MEGESIMEGGYRGRTTGRRVNFQTCMGERIYTGPGIISHAVRLTSTLCKILDVINCYSVRLRPAGSVQLSRNIV